MRGGGAGERVEEGAMAKRPDEPESRTAARNEGTVSVSPTTSATEGGAETEG